MSTTQPGTKLTHPPSLREEVVRQIRQEIIQGRLKPGDHIVEQDLTHRLNVSRTPVREALILLEREGLVEIRPHRGAFVRVFTQEDIRNIFSMRTVLENFAAELLVDALGRHNYHHLAALIGQLAEAVGQRDISHLRAVDMTFHQYLIDATLHPQLIRSWSELVAQIAAVLFLRAEAIPDYDESIAVADHRAILAAYEARDLAAIQTLNRTINQRIARECRAIVAGAAG